MFENGEINKIKNIESKRNFKYVLQSFYSENYKATILLLYNLLINDLYFKLLIMNENGYVNCKNELNIIESNLKEGDESKYSIVEEKIFEIYKVKNVLNHSTIDLLFYFKKIRNKCAHPFFFKENDYNPTYEETYLFIKKIYDDILTVEAFFKDPYSAMENDIMTFPFPELEMVIMGINNPKDDIQKVSNYFEKKYFKRMTDNNFIRLFKSLVDLAITKNNEDIIANQYKHYLLLISMLDYLKKVNKVSILNGQYDWSKLSQNKIYDDVHKKIDEKLCFSLNYLFRVLYFNQGFMDEIKEENEEFYNYLIENLYKESYLFTEFWQLKDYDINNAIDKISENITFHEYCQIISKIYKILSKSKCLSSIENLLKKIPTFDGFDKANEAISLLIEILSASDKRYKQEDLNKIFDIMNNNRQIYDKCRNERNFQLKSIKNLGYNLNEYENLSIEEGD